MLVKESDTVALGCLYELVFGQNKLPKKINNLMNGTEKKIVALPKGAEHGNS